MAYLKILTLNNQQVDLPKPDSIRAGWELNVGRETYNKLCLPAGEISRDHAVFTTNGSNFLITDKGSLNGTMIVRQVNHEDRKFDLVPHKPFQLQNGDIIELGKLHRIRFQNGPIEIGPGSLRTIDNPLPEITMGPGESMTSSPLQEIIEGILEISRTLATKFKEEEIGPVLTEQLIRIFPNGQRFLLFATVPNTNRLRVLSWRVNPNRRRSLVNTSYDDDTPRYSRTIYRMVIEEKKSAVLTDTDSEVSSSMSMYDMGIRSIMVAPVLSPEGHVLGMIQIDADQKSKFQRSDLEILKVIAQQVGATMEMAELHRQAIAQTQLKAEMKYASEIARQFLPHGLPAIPNFEFFAEYQPADDVGGDFYDFTELSDGRMAISVCDVVGHGVPAALIMARLSSDLRNVIRQEPDPCKAFELLDEILMPLLNPPDSFDSRYISMSMSVLDLRTSKLTMVNAGHPPLIIRRADGTLETPDSHLSGRLMGVDFGDIRFKQENQYEKREIQLNPGDIVVYYSDGVTEARNQANEYFGSPEFHILAKVLKENRGGPAQVGEAIIKAHQAFTEGTPQADDVTLVCFGPVAESRAS